VLATGGYYASKAGREIYDHRLDQAHLIEKRRGEVKQETADLAKLLDENAFVEKPA